MRVNLTKKEIVNSIYMQLGFSKKVAEHLLEDFLSIILKELIINGKVKISNFGTFSVKKKNSRLGRNPKTGDEKEITARNVISFYPSKAIKSKIS